MEKIMIIIVKDKSLIYRYATHFSLYNNKVNKRIISSLEYKINII